jgi:hypothetical protein
MIKFMLMVGIIYMFVFWLWAVRAVIRLYNSKVKGSRRLSIFLGFVIIALSGVIGLAFWVVIT